MPSSPDSLLRLVRQGPLAVHPPVCVLGVEDWAWRKGHRYGSLLCDLERHRVIDLLPDRETSTFVHWLRVHPGVAIISRDRAGAYAEGATQGAPMALQVADRFHLVKNLADSIQRVLQRHRSCLVLQTDPLQESDPASVSASSAIVGLRSEKKRLANRAQRVARYQQIVSLHQQGWTIERMAQQVGLSRNTVNRMLRVGHFPERRRRVSTSQALAPYMAYLDQRWAQGCHNATQLWREISTQGFTHGPDMVYRYAVRLRNGLPIASSPASIRQPLTRRRYSPRQAAFLFIRPLDQLQPQEAQDLVTICRQCPDAQQAYDLAQAFVALVHHHQPDALEPWLTTVDHTSLPDLHAFAAGIRRDKAAVLNGLALPWSTAQVEGQINRLKLLKRQMYGRAHFDLLRQRVLTPL
jgi:transposase